MIDACPVTGDRAFQCNAFAIAPEGRGGKRRVCFQSLKIADRHLTYRPMTGVAALSDDVSRIDQASRAARAQADKQRGSDPDRNTSVITRTKPQTKKPSLYRVLLLNDDYTPMEFVIHVLERFFQKDREAAHRIMLHVHNHGVGECGVYTYEVAETKVTQVMDFARQHQHPLQCVMEKN